MNKSIKVIVCWITAFVFFFMVSCNKKVNHNDYTRENVLKLSSDHAFGYGKLDYSLTALNYVYTDSEFVLLYGPDFEATYSGGSAKLKNELSYSFTKGKAKAFIEINKDNWCINLSKPPLGKWTVEDCYLCGNDYDEYGNSFTKYDTIEKFENAIISGEKKQDLNKIKVYYLPKSIPEGIELKEVEVWDDFVAFNYYCDSTLYMTLEWFKDNEFDNTIGLYSNGKMLEKDGFFVISNPNDEYKDILWTQFEYQFHMIILASVNQETIYTLCDVEPMIVK